MCFPSSTEKFVKSQGLERHYWLGCLMGTTDCSKLFQRSREISYVGPNYANYEALEKWCRNWLFVIDEKLCHC